MPQLPGDSLKETLRHRAAELGFQLFGIAPAEPLEKDGERLKDWLARGDAAGMARWFERDIEKRWHPEQLVSGAKSVIVVGASYYNEKTMRPEGEGVIAHYARGDDYHLVLRPKIECLAQEIHAATGAESRVFVDSGPLLEKAYAWRAGLGFIGKNNLLIHPKHGSWFVLGAIVTSAQLPPDEAMPRHQCGECRRCMDACPTGALCEPYRLDARRCISYWTVETRGEIPEGIVEKVGNRLFGCDACQEACPFNAKPIPCWIEALKERVWPTLREILTIDSDAVYNKLMQDSSLLRPRRACLQRNVRILRQTERQPKG